MPHNLASKKPSTAKSKASSKPSTQKKDLIGGKRGKASTAKLEEQVTKAEVVKASAEDLILK